MTNRLMAKSPNQEPCPGYAIATPPYMLQYSHLSPFEQVSNQSVWHICTAALRTESILLCSARAALETCMHPAQLLADVLLRKKTL